MLKCKSCMELMIREGNISTLMILETYREKYNVTIVE